MSAEKQFPLSIVVRTIDKASGPLKAITSKINLATGPVGALGKDFGKLGDALNVDGFMKVGSAMGNVGGQVFALGARLAGLAAGATLAFGALVKGAMDAGDKLGENAERVGLSVDAYASLRYAAEQADVSQEMFGSSMDKLNKAMGDMQAGKGGEFLAFLNTISPTFAKQMKGAKTTEQGLALMTDALAKIEDPQRRASLAAHAFGKSNAQMGVWLAKGSAAIQEQQQKFSKLAGSQEEFARLSGLLDNATRDTSTAFEGLRAKMAVGLFPAITKLSEKVTGFLTANGDKLAAWAEKTGAAISAWVDGGGFDRLVAFLGDVADGAGQVVNFLGPMGTMLALVAPMALPLVASIGSLGMALVAVAPQLIAFGAAGWAALAPLLPFIAAGASLAFLGKTIADNWEPLKFIFADWGNSLRWAVVDAWKTVRPILMALSEVPGLGIEFNAAVGAGDFVSGQVTKTIEARRAVSAAEAARPQSQSTQANVSVSFENLPAGARVTTEPNSSQPVDLSMGYSM